MTIRKTSYVIFLSMILVSSFGLPHLNDASAQLLPIPPLPPPLPNLLNSPPNASHDSAVTDENTPVTINVLANDSDPDGDPLSITSTSTPQNGVATINADNTVTYSPNQDFSGTDSFTYKISDGKGGTDSATVNVTVFAAPENTPPTASNDSAVTDENTPVTINVLVNDSDPDGDALSVTSTSAPSSGAATINSDYTITYSPNSGFTGIDSFTYTISDGNGGTDNAAVTVTVSSTTPENTPPTAADDSAATDEDIPVTVPVLENDSDQDGDTLTVASASTPSNGAATINADNTITYSPNSGFTGSDSFTYTISDGNGGSDTATVTVTVFASVPGNNPPTAVNDMASTDEDVPVTINVLANDSDPDGDTISLVSFDAASQFNGTVTRDDNGTSQNQTDDRLAYTPPSNAFGTDSFTYTISDDNGGTDTATVTVNVAFVNDPPIANDDTAETTINTPVTIDVLANDVDFEVEHSTVIVSVSQPSNGETTNNSGNSITYTPNQDFVGTDTFTYTVADPEGATDTATVTVTVTDPFANKPPVANDDTAQTPVNTPVTIDVLANDTDPNGDTIFLTSFDSTSFFQGTITRDTNGTPTQSDDMLVYNPPANQCGSDQFSYTISDGNGEFDTATVIVTVPDPACS